MSDFASVRANMVESQIRTNKVTDPALIAALRDIPRERFVPKASRGIAYVDEDIAMGHGRFLMEPMVFARLLQAAAIAPSDIVLDVGCARGYSAAVLARLADTVVAVEPRKDLGAEATANMAALGIDNVAVIEASLDTGYPSQAPYDAIVIEGAVGTVPPALLDQLAEGGRLVAVVRVPGDLGRATLFLRDAGVIGRRVLFDAATPMLPGFEPQPSFRF